MPTPSEGTPKPAPLDKDFIHPPSSREIVAENERLADLWKKRDADFSLWLERHKREAQDNPVERAEVLVRAAKIVKAAGDTDAAVSFLIQAAMTVRGHGPQTEEGVTMMIREFGGEAGLKRLSEELAKTPKAPVRPEDDPAILQFELDDVHHQLEEGMKELNSLFWESEYSKTAYGYTEDQRKARIAELRKLQQELIDQRTDLRRRLGLQTGGKK